MRLKNVLSVALATLSVGAGVTLVQPHIALAHHATVTGTPVCVRNQSGDATGWKVNWVADASDDRDVWKIQQSGWAPATEWIGVTTNRTKTTEHTLAEGSASQTATVTWAYYSNVSGDGISGPVIHDQYGPQSDTETVNKPSGCANTGDSGWECPAGTVHDYKIDNLSGPTFTVPTPPAGWTILAVIVKAATEHKLYSPVTPGQVINVKADMGHDVSHVHICKGTVPEPTKIPPPSISTSYDCLSDGNATFTLTPSSGDWTATGDLDNTKFGIRVEVTAKDGFTFTGDANPKVYVLTVTEDNSCEVTAVNPQVNTTQECQQLDSYTIVATDGVIYSKAPGTYSLADGETVTITATADTGKRLTNPGFSVTLTGGPLEKCPIDPPTINGHYDCVADSPATFTLTPSSGNWTATGDLDDSKFGIRVVVTANAGFEFTGGNPTVELLLTVTEDNSCEVTAVAPELITTEECHALDSYTLVAKDGVVYSQTPGTYTLEEGEDATITATAAAGKRLTNPGFSVTLTGGLVEDCPLTPPELVAGYDCLAQEPWAELDPADGEGDHWSAGDITPVDGQHEFTVTITPDAGYYFDTEDVNEDGTLTLTAEFTIDDDCVIDPPVLSANHNCVSQTPSTSLTDDEGRHWTAGQITKVEGENKFTVTITPDQGYRFAGTEGGPITLTATFTVTTGCEKTVALQVIPPTCSEPGSVVTPPSEDYTWAIEGGKFTAVANEGVRLIGVTTFGPFDLAQLTGDECLDPTIKAAAFSPVCDGNIPYIGYSIEVEGTDATVAKLTLIDNTNKEIAVFENMPFTGKFLYPGASTAPDWPGWKFVNGQWVIDGTDHHWRQGLTIRVEVNPTTTASVAYPDAASGCADPATTTTTTTTTIVGSEAQVPPIDPVPQLPKTGSNSTGMATGIGVLLLLGGVALLGIVRRPRRI